jgi:hypothetical protein
MREAVAADGGALEPLCNLAIVLQAQKRLDEATAVYERIVARHPDNVQCLINLGVCSIDRGNPGDGEVQLRRALGIDGTKTSAWANLGVALALQNKNDEAFEAFARAEALAATAGDAVETFVNFALHLREAGRIKEALALYEKKLPTQPSPTAHNDYAYALLTAGKLVEGWRHYEFRWMNEPLLSLRPAFGIPTWDGQDVRGKALLLRAEQGFGDIFQFIRYAPWVKALRATVLLQVRSGLEDLARGFAGIDRVLDRSEPLPPFDFYINLPSLPRIFATDLASIPAEVPYLQPEPERVARWAQRLGDEAPLRVGLVWAGSPTHSRDRYRSIALEALAPLWGVGGVRYVLLQKGLAAADVQRLPAEVDVVNLGEELEDFADTAAVISQLDLVICVDTAVAHLAGALAKPVWVLLPQPADFRWLEEREDSPWYPTMRLFRQTRRDEWSDVVQRVRMALQERMRDGAPATLAKAKRPALPQLPVVAVPSAAPGHQPGFSAVAECRYGIMQYLPDQAVVGDSIGWYGEYLQPELDLLARLMRPGATVVEAGAGIGAHALFVAALLGAEGHLFLYESQPVMQRILRQNLAANRVANVTLMRRVLGSEGEAAGAGKGMGTETLDELQLERLDWLKVDEGASALAILDGAADTLWRLRPLLFLAAEDAPMLGELTERCKGFGYRCWRMQTPLFNAANFNRRDQDIFSGRTALALLAIPEEMDVDITLGGCVEPS